MSKKLHLLKLTRREFCDKPWTHSHVLQGAKPLIRLVWLTACPDTHTVHQAALGSFRPQLALTPGL